jgi:3-deoxy-D-manno-octulosonic-acid transferase
MTTLYTILMTFVLLAAYPVALALALFGRMDLLRRLSPPSNIPDDAMVRVWIHAASVGEAGIAFSTAKELRKRKPGCLIFASTTTFTGLERLESLTKTHEKTVIDRSFLAPFDHPLVVGSFLRKVRPTSFILVETELWPALLRALERRRIPVVIINGKLGRRTFRRYRIFGAAMRKIMSRLSLVCVQSRSFARRYRMLGVPPERIEVLGNIKFDSLPDSSLFKPPVIRSTLGIPPSARVFVAGSTRPGEEEILARAFAEIRGRHPDSLMIVAPRHLNRVSDVQKIFADAELPSVKRSAGEKPSDSGPPVLLLDTMGELLGTFACADAAFVGGSLRDYGGHNPMEPAALGIPILFGPYMEQTGAKELLSGGAATLVHDEHELAEAVCALFENTELHKSMAEAGPKVVARFTGVLARTILCMEARRLLETTDGTAARRHRAPGTV